jgi:ankyrin repeat protein
MSTEKNLSGVLFQFFREINPDLPEIKRYRKYEIKFQQYFPGLYREELLKSTRSDKEWEKFFFETKASEYQGLTEEVKQFYELVAQDGSPEQLEAMVRGALLKEPKIDLLEAFAPTDFLYHVDPFSKADITCLVGIQDFFWDLISIKHQYGKSFVLQKLFQVALYTRQSAYKLKTLIFYGARVNLTSEQVREGYAQPLNIACRSQNIEAAKYFLKRGALINAKSADGTALHIACRHGPLALVILLIENGASLRFLNRDGFSPFHYACFGGQYEVVEYLLEGKVDITLEQNALSYASLTGNPDFVEFLIKKGAGINHGTLKQSCPLSIAIHNGFLPVVKCLLRHGATCDAERKTPLEVACRFEQVEILDYLVDLGNFTVQTHKQMLFTLFFLASKSSSIKIMGLLQRRGVDVNGIDDNGLTALDYVCRGSSVFSVQSVNFLLSAGAAVHLVIPKSFSEDPSIIFKKFEEAYPCFTSLEVAYHMDFTDMAVILLTTSIERMPLEADPHWDNYWSVLKNRYRDIIVPLCESAFNFNLLLLCALRTGQDRSEIIKIISLDEENSRFRRYWKDPSAICQKFNAEVLNEIDSYVLVLGSSTQNMRPIKRILLL